MASVFPERVEAIMLRQADLRWPALQALIEEYGRECYSLGAERLLERLAEEANRPEPCACGDADCPARALSQADGASEEPNKCFLHGAGPCPPSCSSESEGWHHVSVAGTGPP